MVKKAEPRDYNAELLKEIQKVSGTNINVVNSGKTWEISYDVPGDEHVEITGPSLEIIAKSMLFMRLAVEFKRMITLKKSRQNLFT